MIVIVQRGRSCLHIAAWMGHADVVAHFIEIGVDLGARDDGGRTALDLAREMKKVDCVKMLEAATEKQKKILLFPEKIAIRVFHGRGHLEVDLNSMLSVEICLTDNIVGSISKRMPGVARPYFITGSGLAKRTESVQPNGDRVLMVALMPLHLVRGPCSHFVVMSPIEGPPTNEKVEAILRLSYANITVSRIEYNDAVIRIYSEMPTLEDEPLRTFAIEGLSSWIDEPLFGVIPSSVLVLEIRENLKAFLRAYYLRKTIDALQVQPEPDMDAAVELLSRMKRAVASVFIRQRLNDGLAIQNIAFQSLSMRLADPLLQADLLDVVPPITMELTVEHAINEASRPVVMVSSVQREPTLRRLCVTGSTENHADGPTTSELSLTIADHLNPQNSCIQLFLEIAPVSEADQLFLPDEQLHLLRMRTTQDGALHYVQLHNLAESNLERVSMLGAGGYGKVFKYRDTVTEEEWALKQFSVGSAVAAGEAERSLVASYLREICIGTRLAPHRNVVQFLQFYYQQTQPNNGNRRKLYIRMQLMEKSLTSVIYDPNRIWTDMQVKYFAREIIQGLGFLHRHKIIHRDIKSSNILVGVAEEGQINMEAVKITDFGVSRAYVADRTTRFIQGVHRTANEQTQAGTEIYMSPEMFNGLPYTHKTDVWSYGVVLLEMISGKMPYPEFSPGKALVEISLHGITQFSCRVELNCSPELFDVMQRCLTYDAVQRPASLLVEQLVMELPGFLPPGGENNEPAP